MAQQQLCELFPGCQLTLAMNDPASASADEKVVSSFVTWFKRDGQWRRGSLLALPWFLLQSLVALISYRLWRKGVWLGRRHGQSGARRALLQAYFAADLVVSCPGNFLYSSGAIGLPLLLNFAAMIYGVLAGKPVYMLPQTIGPLRRGWEFALLRWLLPRLRVVLLRDETSLALLQRAQIPTTNCHVVPDVAFLYAEGTAVKGTSVLQQLGIDRTTHGPLLGITMINWGAQNRTFAGQAAYEAAMAEAIPFFIQKYGGTVVLFSQVHGPTNAEDDRVPARRVYERLEDYHEQVILVTEPLPPAQLQAAYGTMNLFIGTRLHSNIFALTQQVPVLAIAYQYKTHGVMGLLGLGEWVLDIEGVQAAAVITELQRLWTKRAALRATLAQTLPRLQREIRTELLRIRHDYETVTK
ncbi:MAG: polysaccharide pyruvyl transferase family protein [Caldilineaceae bacterium]